MSAGIAGRELPRSIIELLSRSGDFETALGRLTKGVIRAIAASRDKDVPLTPPQVRDRFDRCMKIATVLLGDMRWSVIRVSDELHHYLKLDLAGNAWEPAARARWLAR